MAEEQPDVFRSPECWLETERNRTQQVKKMNRFDDYTPTNEAIGQ